MPGGLLDAAIAAIVIDARRRTRQRDPGSSVRRDHQGQVVEGQVVWAGGSTYGGRGQNSSQENAFTGRLTTTRFRVGIVRACWVAPLPHKNRPLPPVMPIESITEER